MSTDAGTASVTSLFERWRALDEAGRFDERDVVLWSDPEAVRQYLYSFTLDGVHREGLESYVNDALPRFFHTIRLIANARPKRMLELGGFPYLITVLLKNLITADIEQANFLSKDPFDASLGEGTHRMSNPTFDENHTFSYRTFNLELSDYPYPEGSFDLVLFCEILEHLVVDPLSIFAKLRRLLAPGGKLLLTTPNALRLVNFAFMLTGHGYFDRYKPELGIYGRHNREFSVGEVQFLLESNGFRICTIETLDRYNYNESQISTDGYEPQVRIEYTGDKLRKLLAKVGGDLSHRGDNIYVVAERVD